MTHGFKAAVVPSWLDVGVDFSHWSGLEYLLLEDFELASVLNGTAASKSLVISLPRELSVGLEAVLDLITTDGILLLTSSAPSV
eukprot:scaffold276770_cov132-Cyclotella_meneghiniana.AAC.1